MLTQIPTHPNKTLNVQTTRLLFIDGQPVEAGTRLTLPYAVARQLIHDQKAVRAADEAPAPAPAPAKGKKGNADA